MHTFVECSKSLTLLMQIRYLDESWTGQTPDIAWGKFQKTGFSHLKIWHGKRFTCKMNGMEVHISVSFCYLL